MSADVDQAACVHCGAAVEAWHHGAPLCLPCYILEAWSPMTEDNLQAMRRIVEMDVATTNDGAM
jgi:hypothetical protein